MSCTRLKTEHEQHIAVFGESGSGKTVLVSSFYGATQEPEFLRTSLFDVTADDTGQGHRLHGNYLGMRDSAQPPMTTKLASTAYAFTVKLQDEGAKKKAATPFDAMRLVWHDYPGEWFDEDVADPEVAQRRVSTFKALLGSDVALLLVDGQKLLDNAGEEERYLKSVLGSFRTGILRLKDQLLDDGQPLVKFPRIWILALSKADLLPELDVFGFRDLIISKAADDLGELRQVLASIVDSPEALAVGEDFLRLSSARFEPNKIEVTERIGLDLILPIAAVLPFQRHIKWVQRKQIPAKVAAQLLEGAGSLAIALVGKSKKLAALVKRVEGFFGIAALDVALQTAASLAADQLRELNAEALAKQDYLQAVLTRFLLDLDEGEEARVLLRSKK